MTPTYKQCVSMLAALVVTGAASAHHSFVATFSADKTLSVDGVITDFRFRNPHVLVYLNVSNDDGSVTRWMAEGSSATGWRRAGWKNDSLQVGENLRVTGNATHDGSPMVSIDEMALLDSTGENVVAVLSSDADPAVARGQSELSAATQAVRKPYFIPLTLSSGVPNFSGTTMQVRGLGPGKAGPPDANDPPMPYNEAGKIALQNADLANDPQVFCDQPGVVRQAGYTPYGFKLQQYPDHITIEYEEYGSRRAIFFDDKLPKPGPRSDMGDSVARYEGDALIIETVNLSANFSGHRGKPLSENARVTEVYTRSEDPEHGTVVRTQTTVVDPMFLTKPWTINRYKLYSPDYEFIANECAPPMRARPANVFQYSDFDLKILQRSND